MALTGEQAAPRADVSVREIADLDGLERVDRLFIRIWGANPPVSTGLMRALTKAGNYVAGAYTGTELIGACVAFFGTPADEVLHSHIAGVAPEMAGHGVGLALKLHQRAWALRRGISAIEWTFDPLVSRNAWFNLGKLGATAAEYLPNFYGGMRDGINADDESDRLLVRWKLSAPESAVVRDHHAEPGAVIALGSSRGVPVSGSLDGDSLLVAVPRDIEQLRRSDPGLAKEWRAAVRETLGALLAHGAHVAGFDKSGWYIVRKDDR
ncbi:GNAT family N-acetyltransferase [Amycolatopsis pithecellobii]|uniref:GNAT family N-acetyltransferase n=1 Tax=Amycolatopsis pithecellobii TaxID=664692 RepID=A0A6N7ZAM2_9PSEU|nr:GNAT family N-acetyltransferase [Amycolatopsis pithecellobii]MTD58801.1 GNAT family N-acetyltransferase [Amycolatopsis pithecellobii]